jgi:peptidoglycan/LPS O-acetylase OafA/YrhL
MFIMKITRVLELDALRGIAALMVVFYHYTVDRPQADLGFFLGTTGVELFFMISGFVILMSLNSVKSSLHFIVNRISRLYPTYWACVTFTFIALTIYYHVDLGYNEIERYLGNLTMFQFYFNISDIDDSYWTMIIEMTFYIGMLVLYHLKKLNYLNWIGFIIIIGVSISGLFFHDSPIVKEVFNSIQIVLYLPLFISGTIFYNLYFNKEKIWQRYSLLALCLIAQILSYNYTDRFRFSVNQTQYSIMLIVYYALFSLIVNHKLGFIVSKGTLFLGKISFAVYLIHQAFSIKILLPFFMEDLNFNFWISSLVFSIPIVIIIAALITYFIEIPFGRLLKQNLFAKKLANH